MHWIAAVAGVALIIAVLRDTFETIILPRRATRRYRLTRLFYVVVWTPWRALARRLSARERERVLSVFGPLSLLLLLGVWAVVMTFGFALLQFGLQLHLSTNSATTFSTYLYFSGTNIVTLGLGDILPVGGLARALTVAEGFLGLGFLALVIGYFPVLYQAFSRREVEISLLDARAGSPPSAHELLARNLHDNGQILANLLADWERWAAELMESHLSYPQLCYFRSQHDNESWLASLTVLLDTCALLMANVERGCSRQAEMTFAIARHAVVDLSQVFRTPPRPPSHDRISDETFRELRRLIAKRGLSLRDEPAARNRLDELRKMYEPYVTGLSEFLLMSLPAFSRAQHPDNWQTSAWGRITNGGAKPEELLHDDHA